MSYQLKISPMSLKTSRIISHIQRSVQEAYIKSGLTQQQVADRIGVGRSVINRRLKSKANLTERSLAEFAYAFEKDLKIEFLDPNVSIINSSNTTSSSSFQIESIAVTTKSTAKIVKTLEFNQFESGIQ